MFGHLIASTGDDEAGGGGDVEGVLTVATGANDVDITVGIEDSGNTRLEDTIAEAQQLVDGDATHLQGSQQGSDLFGGILTLSDAYQNILHFFTREFLVVQHPIKDVFHCLCHNSLFTIYRLTIYDLKEEPVLEHLLAVGGEDTLGVELDTTDVQRLVAQGHDLSLVTFRSHLQTVGEVVF